MLPAISLDVSFLSGPSPDLSAEPTTQEYRVDSSIWWDTCGHLRTQILFPRLLSHGVQLPSQLIPKTQTEPGLQALWK